MSRLAYCDCKSHQCGGSQVSYNVFRQHQRADKEYEVMVSKQEEIVSELFSLTFKEDTLMPPTHEQVPNKTTLRPHSHPHPSLIQPPIESELTDLRILPNPCQEHETRGLSLLVRWGQEINLRIDQVSATIEQCCIVAADSNQSVKGLDRLREQKDWFLGMSRDLKGLPNESYDDGLEAIRAATLERVGVNVAHLDSWIAKLADPVGFRPNDQGLTTVQTSKFSLYQTQRRADIT